MDEVWTAAPKSSSARKPGAASGRGRAVLRYAGLALVVLLVGVSLAAGLTARSKIASLQGQVAALSAANARVQAANLDQRISTLEASANTLSSRVDILAGDSSSSTQLQPQVDALFVAVRGLARNEADLSSAVQASSGSGMGGLQDLDSRVSSLETCMQTLAFDLNQGNQFFGC